MDAQNIFEIFDLNDGEGEDFCGEDANSHVKQSPSASKELTENFRNVSISKRLPHEETTFRNNEEATGKGTCPLRSSNRNGEFEGQKTTSYPKSKVNPSSDVNPSGNRDSRGGIKRREAKTYKSNETADGDAVKNGKNCEFGCKYGDDNDPTQKENDVPRRVGNKDSMRTQSDSEPIENVAPPSYIPPPIAEELLCEVVHMGENFERLKDGKIDISGSDVDKQPIERFEDAKLTPKVLENTRNLGLTSLTMVQKWSIPVILQGRDVMVSAQTGSGKTVAFLVPILSMLLDDEKLLRDIADEVIPGPAALIVAPTRELACQIHLEVARLSRGTMIKSAAIYGGLDARHLHRIKRGASIIVGTVGRLCGYLEDKKIDFSGVRVLVLDEADRMLQKGFYEEVMRVTSACTGLNGSKQTLLLSATFPEQIQRLAYDILKDYVFITIGSLGQANEDIKQVIMRVDSMEKKEKLIKILEDISSEKAIVFVQTKRNADALCITLGDFMDKTMTAIHGDLTQKEREEALTFFREGKAEILMATSVAARGLDIQGVKHIINYDLPKDIVEYVHRIGRTGRCGYTGRAVSFFSMPEDLEMARPLVRVLSEAHQEVPRWLEEAALSNPREYIPRTCDMRKNGKFPSRSRDDPEYVKRHKELIARVDAVEEEWI